MRRSFGITGVAALAALAVLFLGPGSGAQAANGSYIDLDQHSGNKEFSAGSENRVSVRKGTVRLGQNPRTARDTSGAYNGGRYYYGTLTSRVQKSSTSFDTVVPSWNARTPRGTWMQTSVRVRSSGSWSGWFNMGVWAKGSQTVKRHSVNGQSTGRWQVLTDTLQSKGSVFANAYQYRVKLMSSRPSNSPVVRKLSFVNSNSYRHGEDLGVPALKKTWGKSLRVPPRTQLAYRKSGNVWCSPTSLSMVMDYWANRTGKRSLDQSVPEVASGVYDYRGRIWGNWPFNTAYASAYGLETTISRFSSIEQIERWTDMGVPVITSIAWDNDYSRYRLSGASLRRSNGHILVVRGFAENGDVLVNDPYAKSNSSVSRRYDRAQFERAWLKNAANRYELYGNSGLVYLMHPANWNTPYSYASKGSW